MKSKSVKTKPKSPDKLKSVGEPDKRGSKEHKQQFEQLLDDAVLGVKKK
ncbi:MAG: hypothetical protein WBX11_07530 [Thiobacillaceae bacterium]